MFARHHVRRVLRLVAATVALAVLIPGPGTPAVARNQPDPVAAVQAGEAYEVCGPERIERSGTIRRFCGQTVGDLGRTGWYYPDDDRYEWADWWRATVKNCKLDGKYLGTDGVRRMFIGYPHFRRPTDGSVYVPGTQYWEWQGRTYARLAYYSYTDHRVHPTEDRFTDRLPREYPPHGKIPARCSPA
ncbi:hypothetical protein [Kribbella catacumbae]|uniref:hypothetical protein n=1 Tax=Kribbella catacumbae TaxID=460086 RepID=UPI0012FCD9F8|nr:hypothetical protein [Kribbella catacumbae]